MTENEVRCINSTIEIRKNEDGTESRTIEGYGVVFNQYSHDLGWFKEKISRNAFDGVDLSEVVATMNHDFNMIMARTTNTLQLTIDDYGVKYRFDAPNTTAGNDLVENVRNGNITGSSFMFTVAEDRWTFKSSSDEVDEREVLKVGRLIELGPVTMPAYPQTTAMAKRSYEQAKESDTDTLQKEATEKRKTQITNKIKITLIKNK
jgi:HK97 family phage prohead protease